MSPNLEEIHQLAQSAVSEGREILLRYFGQLSKVREKELAGLVSEADVESEKAIAAVLKQGLPGIEVLGEESSFESDLDPMKSMSPGSRWILDPLDGTTNYVHGFYVYTISLALEWEGELVYGIVDAPAMGVTYHAKKGQGSYKNEDKMSVSDRQSLSQSLVATGFNNSRREILEQQLETFKNVVSDVRGVRRAGSAAYDLCLVAEGIYDAYWERGLQSWDMAAGALIATEAGGKVSDYNGDKFSPYQDSIVACNPNVYQSLLQRIQNHSPVKN